MHNYRKIYFVVASIFFSINSISQLSRQVINKNSLLPIRFATIKVLHKAQGVIASETGEFKLTLDPDDSVLISCVGYYSVILVAGEIGSAIHLVPKFTSLRNATIRTYKTIAT